MQTVKTSVILLVVLATVLVSSWTCDLPSEQRHTFEELAKVVDDAKREPSLSFKDVETLLSKLQFKNCSQPSREAAECWKCFTATDLFRYFKLSIGSLLNEMTFLQVAPAIIHRLVPNKAHGSGRVICRNPTLPENLFAAFTANLSGSKAGITLETLEKVLESVNETLGQSLTRKRQCFSARSVFARVKPYSGQQQEQLLDEEEFKHACVDVLFYLAQGRCIKKDHGHFPPKSFFLNYLFENRTYLTEKRLKLFTDELGIANPAELEGHSVKNVVTDDEDKKREHVDFYHGVSVWTADEPLSGGNTNYAGKCYNLGVLLDIYNVNHSMGASKCQFEQLCPALFQQFTSRSCSLKEQLTTAQNTETLIVWGYSFAAVTIISVASVVSVAAVPFVGKKMYKKVLALLVADTLVDPVFLRRRMWKALGLLAYSINCIKGQRSDILSGYQAYGLHERRTEIVANGHDHNEEPGFLFKSLVVVAALYCFYLFEMIMHFALTKKTGKLGHSHLDIEVPEPFSRNKSFTNDRKCSMPEERTAVSAIPSLSSKTEKTTEEKDCIILTNIPSVEVNDEKNTQTNKTADTVPQQSQKKIKSSNEAVVSLATKPEGRIASFAWMVIAGDLVHIISDGLAIGAAFSDVGPYWFSSGVSTSIAVLCHEIPHELGDFAVLLSSGMSVKMALLANCFSAVGCYLGLVIGLLLGQMSDARLWIFALTAGIFLYVALVVMLPDLMHSESLHTDAFATFILQNVGLLMGFANMCLIAMYEEQLKALTF